MQPFTTSIEHLSLSVTWAINFERCSNKVLVSFTWEPRLGLMLAMHDHRAAVSHLRFSLWNGQPSAAVGLTHGVQGHGDKYAIKDTRLFFLRAMCAHTVRGLRLLPSLPLCHSWRVAPCGRLALMTVLCLVFCSPSPRCVLPCSAGVSFHWRMQLGIVLRCTFPPWPTGTNSCPPSLSIAPACLEFPRALVQMYRQCHTLLTL